MRILSISSYVYDEGLSEDFLFPTIYFRNKTGFGRVSWRITEYLAKKDINDVYLFFHIPLRQKVYSKVKIISCNLSYFCKNIDFNNFRKMIHFLKSFQFRHTKFIKILYFYLIQHCVENLIQKVKPDVIQIHGLTLQTFPFIISSAKLGFPFVVRLGGLNTFGDPHMGKTEKLFELELIKYLNINQIPLVVVSSGIKKRLQSLSVIPNVDQVYTILNGVQIKRKTISDDERYKLRKKVLTQYGVPFNENIKICINIGSLAKVKNQIDIINSIHILPKDIKKTLVCFIIGEGREYKNLVEDIKKFHLEKRIILTGFLKRNEVEDFYKVSDFLVHASQSEGFGLPMIEAFMWGVPVVAYADLEAVNDIFNENTMIKVPKRGAVYLADGIAKALYKNWDRIYIENWGRNFSWDRTANDYMKLYGDMVERFKYCNNKKIDFELFLDNWIDKNT